MKKMNSHTVMLIVVLILAVIVGGYVYWQWMQAGQTPATSSNTSAVQSSTHSQTSGGLTFTQAIDKYGSTRFEFVNCNGFPGSFTLKKGSKYMLDNRDDAAHTIGVGSQSYKLGALSFAIETASQVGTLNVTCDGGGAAKLIVQP